MTQKGHYDLKKLNFENIVDVNFVVSCCPLIKIQNSITPRFFRHFDMLWIP